MSDFEVPDPIICSPYEEPAQHWRIQEGVAPTLEDGRRTSVYFYPGPGDATAAEGAPTGTMIELKLVTLVRRRLGEWRAAGYPGATRTTIFGWSYYGERCWQYLVGAWTIKPYRVLWTIAVFFGAVTHLDLAWTIADTLNALMAVPNLIALLALSPVVVQLTRAGLAATLRST